MTVPMRALTIGLALAAFGASAHAAVDCATEVAALVKDESELPRLDVVSRADRQMYCITVETVIAFAGRLKAHVAQCPHSPYLPAAAQWERTRADYARRFGERGCRRHF
jgi:hypothetical protein